ncbi:hypothetical protein [Burkholderia sp. PU8-34]
MGDLAMLRLSICSAMLLCGTAFAAQPADNNSPLLSAAPTQVLPPLPPLASLPPTSGGDEDVPEHANVRHAKKLRHAPPVKRAPEFQVHLVVSDASRAALAAVDKKLDDALENGVRDRRATGNGASALAMSH